MYDDNPNQVEIEFDATLLLKIVAVALAILLAFSLLARADWAKVAGEWEGPGTNYPNGIPDNVKSWFKGVRSPNGVPCCDISDGHRTDYDIRPESAEGTSGYWVPIAGEWRPVPKEAVIHNADNPTGEAIVWYVQQGHPGDVKYFVRCFLPGGGV